MKIQLSDHFTYKKLMRFTLPSIVMMIFTSIYGVVDGFFVSNFVGKTPFAAVNFIYPFLMILGAVGFMFGTGGSALIAKTMGEGNRDKANRLFSLFVYLSVLCGAVITALGMLLLRPIAALLGAQGEMLDHCVLYGRLVLAALPAFILQMEFQSFFITGSSSLTGDTKCRKRGFSVQAESPLGIRYGGVSLAIVHLCLQCLFELLECRKEALEQLIVGILLHHMMQEAHSENKFLGMFVVKHTGGFCFFHQLGKVMMASEIKVHHFVDFAIFNLSHIEVVGFLIVTHNIFTFGYHFSFIRKQ